MTRTEPEEAPVAQHGQEVTVRTMRPAPGGDEVCYASVPEICETSASFEADRARNRIRLVTILVEHLRAKDSLLSDAHPPIRIAYDTLGRPRLLLGEHPGPAVSFSAAGGEVWAALCGANSDIGIDVAGSAEFPEGYPLQRVFHEEEFQQAIERTHGDPAQAAALLWSIKEAVVKALGCAFHLADPRDLHVSQAAGKNGETISSVRLSGKALLRFPRTGLRPISVRSLSRAGTSLSIAAADTPRRRTV